MSRQHTPAPAWSFPMSVADLPEAGRHVDIAADDGARQNIAKAAGLAALPRFEAAFDLSRQGSDGLRLMGRVSATVVQNCVVTLEPIESQIDEEVDLAFAPRPILPNEAAVPQGPDAEDPPETLHDGTIDLGAVATEFLLLGIDPYPRKPGVVFDVPPAGDPSGHPFAALAALKKSGGGKDG